MMKCGATVNLRPERKVEPVRVLSGQFNWAAVNRDGYVIALFSQKIDATSFLAAYEDGYYTLREVEND